MIATTEKMHKKSMSRPEETRSFDKGRVDVVTMGSVTFGRMTLQPGWKWSNCVKPLVNLESSEAPHLAYHISGRLCIKMDDGTEQEFGPGDISFIPPGHDAWVVGSEPVVAVDIAGMREYAKQ